MSRLIVKNKTSLDGNSASKSAMEEPNEPDMEEPNKTENGRAARRRAVAVSSKKIHRYRHHRSTAAFVWLAACHKRPSINDSLVVLVFLATRHTIKISQSFASSPCFILVSRQKYAFAALLVAARS